MTNDDFQLEELESAAVKKSNNAKRAAAIGAAMAGSGAVGAAGATIVNNMTGGEQNPEDVLSPEDIESGAQVGADQVQAPQAEQPEQAAPVAKTPPAAQQPHHEEPAQPQPQPGDDVDISFDKTTHIYDENNELLATTEEGTLEGKSFTLIDVDGDMNADVLAYDADGNHYYSENEIVMLSESDQIAMGNPTSQHEDVWVAVNEPVEPDPFEEPLDPFDIEDEKELADNEDIHNDFEDEKTGESYSHDYAENNENYNNDGDVEHYTASSELAYEDSVEMEEEDADDFETLASNDTVDDSNDDLGGDDFVDFA